MIHVHRMLSPAGSDTNTDLASAKWPLVSQRFGEPKTYWPPAKRGASLSIHRSYWTMAVESPPIANGQGFLGNKVIRLFTATVVRSGKLSHIAGCGWK